MRWPRPWATADSPTWAGPPATGSAGGGPGYHRVTPIHPGVGAARHRARRVAGVVQGGGGGQAAPPRRTYDIEGIGLGDLVLAGGQLPQGEQLGPGDVGRLVLVGVADVEHDGAGGVGDGEGLEVDFELGRGVGHGPMMVPAGSGD